MGKSLWESQIKKNFIPYEIGRFVYLPGHNPIGFLIRLSPMALETHGILEKITHVFASRNISILHFKMSRPVPGKPLYMLLFADVWNSVLVGTLSEEIKKVRYVDEVNVIKPLFDGFTTDKFFFPLVIAGNRAIVLRKPLYEGFIRRLRRELGSGYEAILYYMGVEMGREAFRDHVKIAGRDFSKLVRVTEEFFRLVGFGIIKVISIELGNRCVVRVFDSFECELFTDLNECSSHLIRGILAGWFAEASGVDDISRVKAIEISCIAKGDPYCEIVIVIT